MTTTRSATTRTAKTVRIQRVWSLEARRERSLELADERGGGMWAVHFVEAECDPFSGELLRLQLEVDSAHDEWTRYQVQYVAHLDVAFCSCAAGSAAAPCWHAGQAVMYGRYARDAYGPKARAEAERAYLREMAHEGNAAALQYVQFSTASAVLEAMGRSAADSNALNLAQGIARAARQATRQATGMSVTGEQSPDVHRR